MEKQTHVLEDLDQLSLSRYEEQTSTGFSPLRDVPVDSYNHTERHTSSNTSALIPNWLLTENTHSDSAQTPENDLTQDAPSLESKRGQLPLENEHSVIRRDGEERPGHDVLLTVVDMPRHKRPLLSQVFSSLMKSHSSSVSPVEQCEQHQSHDQQRSARDGLLEQEFEFTTVNVSKTKQSLGTIGCYLSVLNVYMGEIVFL